MDSPLRKLTLVFPKAIEATVIDTLDGLAPALPGYTSQDGFGRGSSMHLASASEKVKGAMRIFSLLLILPEERIFDVLEAIRCACPRRQISYWVEPVLEFGRLQ